VVAGASRAGRLRQLATEFSGHAFTWGRSSWVDVAWVAFVALNRLAMRLLPAWQTVPFLAIWVSLTVIYGFRLWRIQPTILTLAAVTIATSGIIGVQVLKGQQDADYLAEVPLIALMFLVMVWHGRERLAATEERLAAMEEVQRVSQENLRLLKQQRRFLQDASHELGTPITVALGHAELIERAVTNPVVAEDARVVTDELMRLRRCHPVAAAGLGRGPRLPHLTARGLPAAWVDALDRRGHIPRRWRLGPVAETTVLGDRDRLAVALDALLENAVAYTTPGDRIEVSARLEDGGVVLAVADSGCGIQDSDLRRIFQRFGRAEPHRSRPTGGLGLGLAIVQAIAEAHGGSVTVQSTFGHGSEFEVHLPLAPPRRQEPGTRSARRPGNGQTGGPIKEPSAAPGWVRACAGTRWRSVPRRRPRRRHPPRAPRRPGPRGTR
jgi:signal transduction histidine kinase